MKSMQSWALPSIGLLILAVVLGGVGVAGRHTLPAADSGLVAAALQDALIQNTPGFSEGFPAGVPRSYAWCNGAYRPDSTAVPPAEFSAVTGWGQVYRMHGAAEQPGPQARVMVADFRTYVRLSVTQKWLLVQSQAADAIAGGHFVADFGGNQAIEMPIDPAPDGAVAIGVPPRGYNSHFWIDRRGTFAPGSVNAVYVQMELKAVEAEPGLVANVGADWWRDAGADYVAGFSNNPGVGMSNWIALSSEWTTLRFYSGNADEFIADPPPPLRSASTATLSTINRHQTNTPTPCLAANPEAAR